MRDIGRGQRLCVLIIPEISRLISTCDSLCRRSTHAPLSQSPSSSSSSSSPSLSSILVWLILSGAKSEEKQHKMLCEQSVKNVWRKKAMTSLILGVAAVGQRHPARSYLQKCIDVFLDRVDHLVDPVITAPVKFLDHLKDLIQKNRLFVSDPEDHATLMTIMGRFETDDYLMNARDDDPDDDAGFQSEQIAEQEQEQEQEEEQEQEQEQEMEAEDASRPAPLSYSRKDEIPDPWPLVVLGVPQAVDEPEAIASMFSSLSKLGVYNSLLPIPRSIPFPPYLFTSDAFFRPRWSLVSHRRMKNVIVIMEWTPDMGSLPKAVCVQNSSQEGAPKPSSVLNWLSEKAVDRPVTGYSISRSLTANDESHLKKAFSLFDYNGKGYLGVRGLREALIALDVDVTHLNIEAELHKYKQDDSPGITFLDWKVGGIQILFFFISEILVCF